MEEKLRKGPVVENKDARVLGSREPKSCLEVSSWGTSTLFPQRKEDLWKKDKGPLSSAKSAEVRSIPNYNYNCNWIYWKFIYVIYAYIN